MAERRIVTIKIGSNSLVDGTGRLDLAFVAAVAQQFATVVATGWQPVLVTSGAVAGGLARLGLAERPPGLSERQALAAIGQIGLVKLWEDAFNAVGLVAAQVLLTHDDFSVRHRYLNLIATFQALFAFGCVPVINENDTVAVEELSVGDNDRLSALVATQLGAERLILLTDIDGVYDADPRSTPTARRLDVIPVISAAMVAATGGAGARGRGGMRSKLESARLASAAGVITDICAARTAGVITRVLADEHVGTRVPAHGARADSRRRWLAVARRVHGAVTVDAGAARALVERGRSLLPAGITAVEGRFARGDTIAIRNVGGDELARGLAGMSSDELSQIAGKRLDAASALLGYALPKAAVHRDNLLLLAR